MTGECSTKSVNRASTPLAATNKSNVDSLPDAREAMCSDNRHCRGGEPDGV